MIIALVGAGGKTSLGNQIGTGLSGMGRRVLFTTTTKINRPENHPLFLGAAQEVLPLGFFMTAAKSVLENGKLEGYSPAEIGVIANSGLFDDIIVEADGAARKPVKAPNETEPVYPARPGLVIGVIGLRCLGQPINDQTVHRAALFVRVAQAAFDAPVGARHIVRLINHPDGLFRYAPADTPKVVFLNQCDTMDEKAMREAQSILRQSLYPAMLTGYHTDWFGAFYNTYLKGESHAD